MRFGSVCSGIEAASVAWGELGWQAAWLSEIEPFPSAVLAHHYPDVPNLGDMTTLPDRIRNGEVEAPDLFCGGTPCQAFSVAGLRKSLDDARGNLSLTFCEIANAIDHVRAKRGHQPTVVFWENVPGVLNTKDNAFGCFLGALAGEVEALEPPGGKWTNAGCVSGPQRTIAWRVLDAQYFGVAQRRRRVFVVASARNDVNPLEVLFELDGVRRDSAPSREAGQNAAKCLTRGAAQRLDYETEDFVVGSLCARTGQSISVQDAAQGHLMPQAVAQPITIDEEKNANIDMYGTLQARRESGGFQGAVAVPPAMQVRRLTPVECERLQGFPDNYTAIPWRKKPATDCPDGPRYKALGNSWAVPNVRWIGRRIDEQIIGGLV